MRIVLDASVAVAAQRRADPAFVASGLWLRRILSAQDELLVPTLFQIEVTSALLRAGTSMATIETYLDRLLERATEIAPLGPKRAAKVADLAARSRLRAADSFYVWLASERRATLVTGDVEILERAVGICKLASP
jgi:predicted nucleic acid-binding protein